MSSVCYMYRKEGQLIRSPRVLTENEEVRQGEQKQHRHRQNLREGCLKRDCLGFGLSGLLRKGAP